MIFGHRINSKLKTNMKNIYYIAGLFFLFFVSCKNEQTADNESDTIVSTEEITTSDLDSVSYSIGVNVAQSLKKQGLDDINAATLAQAISDFYEDESSLKIAPEAAGKILQGYYSSLVEKRNAKNLADGKAFLETNKKREGVVTLASGLQYEILRKGTGKKPKSTDKVKVHYHGTLIDGRVFDSSVKRGDPISFPVTGVIQGWVEALQLMPVGSKWKLFIPTNLAYGKRPQRGGIIEPNMALIFEVELLEIEK